METTKFILGYSNVKSIAFDKYEQNFTFNVDGRQYKTSRVLADFLSPIVNNYHHNDETINEITITTNKSIQKQENGHDYFSDFLYLSTFQEQELDEYHKQHYLEYFLQLGNINEYLRLQPEYFDELSPSNIVDRLKFMHKQKIDSEMFNKVITYASNNFDSISYEEKKRLDVDILELIIGEASLKIDNEDSLLEFILELYEEDRKYSVLFEYVIFSNVSEEMLRKFIDKFDINNINVKIWERICNRLLTEKKTDETRYRYKEKVIEREHKEGDELNGLLRYLSDETGGNIHDNGTIKITTNSCTDENSLHPKNLVDNYQNSESNYYHSTHNSSGIYVCFDLKDRQIQLTSYSIKSYNGSQNWCHLKNWKMEVSNNGNDWTTIDEHSNDSTLNSNRVIGTFNIKQETNFYRFIRLHQTGTNWSGDNYMIFYSIEFYGKLKEP